MSQSTEYIASIVIFLLVLESYMQYIGTDEPKALSQKKCEPVTMDDKRVQYAKL